MKQAKLNYVVIVNDLRNGEKRYFCKQNTNEPRIYKRAIPALKMAIKMTKIWGSKKVGNRGPYTYTVQSF